MATEKKKGKSNNVTIIVFVILGLLALFGLSSLASNDRGGNNINHVIEISFNDYLTLKENPEKKVIYFAKPDCPWCTKFKPILRSVLNEYNIDVYYYNTNNLLEEEYNSLLSEPLLSEGFGTPSLIVVQNGKITHANLEYIEKDQLIEFFRTSGIIIS